MPCLKPPITPTILPSLITQKLDYHRSDSQQDVATNVRVTDSDIVQRNSTSANRDAYTVGPPLASGHGTDKNREVMRVLTFQQEK